MNPPLESRAAGALWWRGVQLVAVSVLALVRLLVLARLLSPDDFGLFAIAVTALGVAASVTDLGLVPALVQRPDASEREMDTAWTLGVARGALLAAVVALAAGPVAAWFHEPRAAPVLRVAALLPLVQALASIGTVRLTRRLAFRRLALPPLADAAVNTAVAVALAPIAGAGALVAGALGGAMGAVLASYAVAPRNPRFVFDRAAARPLLGFGGWLLMASALGAATDFVLRAAIARHLGADALGVFAVAAGLAFLPVNAAAEVTRSVGFPLYARLALDPAALRRAFRALATGLVVTLVPVYAVLAVAAPGLARDVLGPAWAGAAPVLRLMSVACILSLLGEAAVPLFQGIGRPRIAVALDIGQLAVVTVLAGPLAAALGLAGAALAWLGAAVVSLVLSVVVLRRVLGPAPELRRLGGVIAGSGAAAAVVALAVPASLPGAAGVLAGVAAGLAAAAALWQVDRSWGLGMMEDVRVLIP